MSELTHNNSSKTSSAKKTLLGLIIFAIICIAITCACIYMTLENRKQNTNDESTENTVQEETVSKEKPQYKTLKLTDKAKLNGITENNEEESYGEVVYYYEYNNSSEHKLEIDYVQISGLKDRNVQARINQRIKDKVDELKEECLPLVDDDSVNTMWINASLWGSFADVISIRIESYVHYADNEEEYYYDSKTCGLNFSLATGDEIKLKDLFWDDSPIKTILSQSAYRELARNYAFESDVPEWDMNFEKIDYSAVESKVYNFMYKYNKNPDIEFYFSPSDICIPYDKTTIISVDMAEFYEYIAIYSKYLASKNLYEDTDKQREFYVFSSYGMVDEDYEKESGMKADNVYYRIYNYDDLEDKSDEFEKALQESYRSIIKKINEYVKTFKEDKDNGYIIEGYYSASDVSEYSETAGYNLNLEVASCDRKYLEEHLEDALAKSARSVRVDIMPSNFAYIDSDNFEFYESYSEYSDNYADSSVLRTSSYTKEDRDRDMQEWENYEEEYEEEFGETEENFVEIEGETTEN